MAIKNENILGVDIGGSKVNLVVWDGQKIVEQKQITGDPNKDNLKAIVEEYDLQKIGLGVPGIFNMATGQIIKCPNAPQLNGLNLKKLWPDKIVKIDNDARCFLRAEAMLGAGKGYNNILAVVFGTGIGGAIKVQSAKCKVQSWGNYDYILKGKDGWAGEFGHMIIDRGKSWERLYQATKNKPREQEKINAIGLANLINIFNPEIIILGGKGAVEVTRLLRLQGTGLLEKNLLWAKAQMPKIVLAKLGQNASAIGAALLF
ncbi:hypothetical protein COZ78_02845 [bacterium (Candidatus Gribaldobacteria) CG_4_8_14_3_um_filter_42_11]|uniref:ROK family protein n=1 Tax=bacterium (Candidatus Gribaldobacteria) CG_4_8_14_3_um_filter_42_11 TaxID=2014267 RepID=A0A2M7IXS9_9BACT|nr:MAG: hypothetical protein COZ78_02845 [bacterium (Candidatus Gribaldobacteria) CG_4_8_14_3_um_filter_42_11]